MPVVAGSLVLQDARERHMSGSKYADVPMGGIYLVRGENVVIVGEVVRRVAWRGVGGEGRDATHCAMP